MAAGLLAKPAVLMMVAAAACLGAAAASFAVIRKRRDPVVRFLPHVDVSAYNAFPVTP